ncbi:hypothetical protein [Streptococcus pneumoniae]|uniref:hypothetical protein n=1 Tax=Streptococcus pneumoniae TaxID=1313 RepID=UPI0015D8E9A5|nr:hypothetical protein [Streptococcus pneumoniae]
MRTKASLRKLVTGCSKHCFEVVDKTDDKFKILVWEIELTKSAQKDKTDDK